jgi:hypothetical protein
MAADFPLLSNEILLPNLVFFRGLLERKCRLILHFAIISCVCAGYKIIHLTLQFL